jgi:hypothetical protein
MERQLWSWYGQLIEHSFLQMLERDACREEHKYVCSQTSKDGNLATSKVNLDRRIPYFYSQYCIFKKNKKTKKTMLYSILMEGWKNKIIKNKTGASLLKVRR